MVTVTILTVLVMIFRVRLRTKTRPFFEYLNRSEGYFNIKLITFWDFWQTFFNFFQLFTFFPKTKQSKNRNISEWNHETFHGRLTPDDASDAPSRHRHRQNITIVDVLHRLGYCVQWDLFFSRRWLIFLYEVNIIQFGSNHMFSTRPSTLLKTYF